MKRLTLIVALLLLVAVPMMAERVSPETARKVATTFLNNNGAKANQLTDLTKEAGFPNLYIFNGEEGFVVMSADDCVKPILGYSLTGKFVAEGMPENVSGWLQGYNDEIQYVIDNKITATAENAKMWNDLAEGNTKAGRTSIVVDPLTQTLWDQTQYYNIYCPAVSDGPDGRAYTGCVATAMAQIMKYWEYPLQGTGTHSYTWNSQTLSADFGSTSYDWGNMTNTYGSSSTDQQIQAVSTLMYHCGVSVDMNYGGRSTGGSGAYSQDVAPALINYFNYSPSATLVSKSAYSDEQWKTFLKSELEEGRPLYYSGSNTNSGHAFVCDGYRSDDYFHFNWGWSGSDGSYGNSHGNNGYWAIGSLSPGAGGSGSGSGTYNLNNAVIAWLEPISTLPAPTITASTSEGIVSLTWNVVDGASSYNVYRDNVKIIEGLSSTTYLDNDITFGVDYVYHVRAVSSEATSNPSNFISIRSDYRDIAPSNLTISYNSGNALLNWTGYAGNLSTDLHYATERTGYVYGNIGAVKYWGQRFPVERMNNYCGMDITEISCCFYYASTYSLYIYNGSLISSDKIAEQSFTKSSNGYAWKDFTFDTPLTIDCSKDLWIVLYNNDENLTHVATEGEYNGNDYNEANYMSSTLSDLANSHSSSSSWLIRTYLTDGTYTYNLYDGTSSVASNIDGTSYTVESPTNNTAHQYTVKTAYIINETTIESDPSNMAGLTLGTASLSALALGDNDKMTVTEGSTLTVSSTLSNNDETNLILENGAQLIHSSAGVKATVKKDIAAYTADDNGWYFIASPITKSITPSADNGLLANSYDLYKFDQSQNLEWRNYESTSQPFSTLDHKTGYLYANSGNPTLTFAGTLAATTDPTALTYDGNASFKGFNLIGNPYPCNTTVNKDFYVISGNTVTLAESGRQITPCEGVFVKATGENESVTFTKATASAKGTGAKDCFDVVVTQGRATLDRARVRLGEGIGMEKFTLDDSHTQISLWQDGQQFAVAYANGQSELPLNFKATRNGSYTLTFEIDNLELDYLHLIDNRTGDDVDLLALRQAQGPASYTFEAKTTDYASRFKLVFSNCEDAVGDNAAFAYVNNGNIVVNEEGTLQMVDMTGRIVVSGDAKHCVPTAGMTAGVYVLRLITADGVKTQKIVIK